MEYLLIGAAPLLAFANGADDNFKGFATVWGSDTLSYRQALLLAHDLVQQFSGKGLLPAAFVEAPQFIFSSETGAALMVIIATRAGLPISTTHALIGTLLGAGGDDFMGRADNDEMSAITELRAVGGVP